MSGWPSGVRPCFQVCAASVNVTPPTTPTMTRNLRSERPDVMSPPCGAILLPGAPYNPLRSLRKETFMSAENKAAVRRWFDEVWNQGRSDAIDELISERSIRSEERRVGKECRSRGGAQQ